MVIRCWGSRGSIPVSGKAFDKYGGDTTCMEVRSRGGRILIIDAGSGIRRLGRQLVDEKRLDLDLIFTHAHWDHLMGFPFFRPLYLKKARLRIHGCPFAERFVRNALAKVMSPPNFPVRMSDLKASIRFEPQCPDRFEIDTIRIEPIRLSHPNGGNGYRLTEDGKVFVFITDNELGYTHKGGHPLRAYAAFARGADLLVHDAEYTDEAYPAYRTWGHSTWQSALELAARAGVKRLGLFHHNQDRTDRELDGIVKACRQAAREKGARLNVFAVRQDMTIEL